MIFDKAENMAQYYEKEPLLKNAQSLLKDLRLKSFRTAHMR